MSVWSKASLEKYASKILMHELTHFMIHSLRPFLFKKKEEIFCSSENLLKTIERIVFDEGIAHFIGFPSDRSLILKKYTEKKKLADKKLKDFKNGIQANVLDFKQKEQLFYQSNSGEFWNKFAAISGMFQAAEIYERSGIDGIVNCIKCGRLF